MNKNNFINTVKFVVRIVRIVLAFHVGDWIGGTWGIIKLIMDIAINVGLIIPKNTIIWVILLAILGRSR